MTPRIGGSGELFLSDDAPDLRCPLVGSPSPMALLNFIRRHRLLAILVFLFVLVILFYHPILVGIGQFLVVNQE
ncbi:MAG: hypothetical protein ACLFN4_07370, partial [Candidatus Acetothermia bacterium]